jgi:hypothetical protein
MASANDAVARAETEAATGRRARVLDPAVPATVWAHDLYAWLRTADDDGIDVLVVVAPPDEGVGVAVNDRLRKAAAPRP